LFALLAKSVVTAVKITRRKMAKAKLRSSASLAGGD
jgi:hypothetical protein